MDEMIKLVFDGTQEFYSRTCVYHEVEKQGSTVKMKYENLFTCSSGPG
jgi:hypothetical protein